MSKYKAYLKTNEYGFKEKITYKSGYNERPRFSDKAIVHAIECGRVRTWSFKMGKGYWEIEPNVFDGVIYKQLFVEVHKGTHNEVHLYIPYHWTYDRNKDNFKIDIIPLGECWKIGDEIVEMGFIHYNYWQYVRFDKKMMYMRYPPEKRRWTNGIFNDSHEERIVGALSYAKALRVYDALPSINFGEKFDKFIRKELNFRCNLEMPEFAEDEYHSDSILEWI